jgi:hypothetical protein
MEIDCLSRNDTFTFKITLDRHNATQKLIYCLLPDPPHFSLPSTFKPTFYPPAIMECRPCLSAPKMIKKNFLKCQFILFSLKNCMSGGVGNVISMLSLLRIHLIH